MVLLLFSQDEQSSATLFNDMDGGKILTKEICISIIKSTHSSLKRKLIKILSV